MTTVRDSIRKLGAGASTARPAVLEAKPPQGAMPPVVGKGRTPAAGGGSGDTLQETSYADRTYWADETFPTSDGAFVWIAKPTKRVKLTSGNFIQFADPTP